MLKFCPRRRAPGCEVPGCRLRWAATSESLATDFGAGDVRASEEAGAAPLRSFFCAAAASALASASAAWNCTQVTQRGVPLETSEEVMLPLCTLT